MKIVKLKWIDSSSAPSGWEYIEDIPSLKPAICHTIGYVLDENKKFIVIASTISKTQILGRIVIPKCCILKKKILFKK